MPYLACPRDGTSPLTLDTQACAGDVVRQGVISCQSCGLRFEVAGGIPILMPMESGPIAQIKDQEIEARNRAYRRHQPNADLDELVRYPELDALRKAVADCRGLTVLDAGCGVGKMTQVLGGAARVIGIDFAYDGLLNFDAAGHRLLDLVQGDVCRLPFRSGVFDLAISSQLLEHLPSKESRTGFLAQAARTLKAGARFVITVYNWDRNRSEKGVSKEGFHPNGIFYHCYSREELIEELAPHFKVEAVWGVQVLLPWTYQFVRALGRKYRYWDRLWWGRPRALLYSNLLLAICRRHSGNAPIPLP